jgi:hypothetical protein
MVWGVLRRGVKRRGAKRPEGGGGRRQADILKRTDWFIWHFGHLAESSFPNLLSTCHLSCLFQNSKVVILPNGNSVQLRKVCLPPLSASCLPPSGRFGSLRVASGRFASPERIHRILMVLGGESREFMESWMVGRGLTVIVRGGLTVIVRIKKGEEGERHIKRGGTGGPPARSAGARRSIWSARRLCPPKEDT